MEEDPIWKRRSLYILYTLNWITEAIRYRAVEVQGVPKKKGLVIVVILAPKIIFKPTPILLDIQVPYSSIILSYCGGLCHYQFVFYGYFSLGGLVFF